MMKRRFDRNGAQPEVGCLKIRAAMWLARAASAALLMISGSLVFAAPAQAQFTISQLEDLAFGAVIVGMSSGSVTVTSLGVVSTTGAIVQIGGDQPAAFQLAGPAATPYALSFPGTATVISGANSMTIRGFEADKASGTTQGLINPIRIQIGATIDIAGNQAPGDYFGTFAVTVIEQ